jgi:hypothetical protein
MQTSIPAEAKGQAGTQSLSYRLSTCVRKPTHLLRFITLGRWRNAGRVLLPLNLRKIHFQDLPSFLHASKRCSSIGSHGIFTPVLKPCFSSLKHRSSSPLGSGSLSLKSPSSSLLDGSLPCDARAWACVAYLGLVRVASL